MPAPWAVTFGAAAGAGQYAASVAETGSAAELVALPSAMFPNAPADLATIWDAEWVSLPARDYAPWYEQDNGSGLGTGSAEVDPYTRMLWEPDLVTPWAPGGTGRSVRITIPSGFGGGYSPAALKPIRWVTVPPLSFTSCDPSGRYYHGLWFKFTASSGEYDTNGNQQKLAYYSSRTAPGGFALNHMLLFKAANCGDLSFELQDNLGSYAVVQGTAPTVNDSQWHRAELLFQRNTFTGATPNANGMVRVWLDNVLVASSDTAVIVRNLENQNTYFDSIELNAITGGGLNPAPKEQYLHYGRTLLKVAA